MAAKIGKRSFKKPLGDPKIQQIVTAAIGDKFVNSREGGESRDRSQEQTRKFMYRFLGVIISCLVIIPSVVNAVSGDDEEEKENCDRGLRFKGCFVSQQQTPVF